MLSCEIETSLSCAYFPLNCLASPPTDALRESGCVHQWDVHQSPTSSLSEAATWQESLMFAPERSKAAGSGSSLRSTIQNAWSELSFVHSFVTEE